MSRPADDPAVPVARLLRWYPRTWRDRYGAEFAELLLSDLEERPRSAARTLDVMRGGVLARFASAGLCGFPLRSGGATPGADAADSHVTASLISLGCCAAVFLSFGAAMWSQLTIAWQWSGTAGATSVAGAATVATTAAMPVLLVLAILAALPVLFTVAKSLVSRHAKGLRLPSAVLVAAATIVVVGGRHFENGWPGTGGHGGLIPGGLAAFEWATSLSVSSYWGHPGALASFPAAEVAWMAVSPFALAATVISAAIVVRRTRLSRRVLLFETRLAIAACAVMVVFLAGCCCWVATEGQTVFGQPSLFHAGFIDVAGMVALTLALALAQQAARTAWRGLSLARS
jgi:hypothetical protein